MLKKRILSAVAAIAIAVSCCLSVSAAPATMVTNSMPEDQMVCADSANILKDANWDFENGEKYWRLVNTIDNEGSAYYYTMAITDDNPHSGKCSLMLDGLATWANIKVPFKVKKNTQYTFSMWVHASNGWTGDGNTIIKMVGYPDGDYVKGKALPITGDLGLQYTGEWYQFGFTIDTGDLDMVALYICDGGGTIYFDDMRFFETNNPNGATTAKPANLEKIQAKEKQEAADKASSTATTPKPESKPESKPVSSGAASSAAQEPQTGATESQKENIESKEETTESVTEDIESTDNTTSEPSESTDQATDGESDNDDQNGVDPLLIVVIILSVVIVLGVVAFVVWQIMQRKKNSTNTEN